MPIAQPAYTPSTPPLLVLYLWSRVKVHRLLVINRNEGTLLANIIIDSCSTGFNTLPIVFAWNKMENKGEGDITAVMNSVRYQKGAGRILLFAVVGESLIETNAHMLRNPRRYFDSITFRSSKSFISSLQSQESERNGRSKRSNPNSKYDCISFKNLQQSYKPDRGIMHLIYFQNRLIMHRVRWKKWGGGCKCV